MGQLIVVVGPSGAGKTSACRVAAEILAKKKREIIPHIAIDELRDFLVTPPQERHGVRERITWKRMLVGLLSSMDEEQTPIVLVDGLWYDRTDIHPTLAPIADKWPLRLLHLSAPLDLCLKRNRERRGKGRLFDTELEGLWHLPAPAKCGKIRIEERHSVEEVAGKILTAAGIW